MNTPELLIVTVNNHPVLGPLLVPFFAKEESPGLLKVVGNAMVEGRLIKTQSKEIRKIISLAEGYTERNLMKTYSKERMLAEFFKKLTKETLTNVIRPYIDKKHREIVRLMQQEGVLLYVRDSGAELLYEHHRFDVSDSNIEVRLVCKLDEEYFRYALHCYQKERRVNLQMVKPYMVLSSSPAILIVGKDLLVFDKIRSGRIAPFLERDFVEAPASEVKRYLKNVVIPMMADFSVEASGFVMEERRHEAKAVLRVQTSLSELPELRLVFMYGKDRIQPSERMKLMYPRLEDHPGGVSISYFKRDSEWERTCLDFLTGQGFRLSGDSAFTNPEITSDFELVDWLNANKEEIASLFSYEENEEKEKYYIGEINVRQDLSTEQDWFEVRITVEIGEYRFPFVRFRKNILSGERRFRLPDGRVALLPEEWFEKYADLFAFGKDDEDKIILRSIHAGVVEELKSQTTDIAPPAYSEKVSVPVPPKIRAVLRPYQQEGFSWLVHLMNNRLGGCLADDMGLGKTLQTIALLQHLYDPNPPLEVKASNDAKSDDNGQFSFFGGEESPDADSADEPLPAAERLHASLIVVPTSLVPNWKREIRRFSSLRIYEYSGERRSKNACRAFDRYHIVLTTYGMLRRDIELLEDYHFKYVILDESQYIKNPGSQTYESVMRLKSEYRLTLTGTPIENSLKDLWTQLNFINPGLLGTASFFKSRYITPITKNDDTRMRDKLLKLISPFILRRTKKQVAPELPPLTEEVIFCQMSPEQKELYTKEKNGLRNSLLDEWHKNRIIALNGILRLRQLANHPAMVYPEYPGASGKMEQILEVFETLLSEGHKVLIFSSFVSHLNLLAEQFREQGWKYALLTGSTLEREKEISRFSQNDDVAAFLISLKAGGVGLNLTDADYVFIIDPWWNPAAEVQAESRAHRIGQDKQVFVYRFISAGTIEERIRMLQERKSQLAETFIMENDPLQTLSDHEWRELLEE